MGDTGSENTFPAGRTQHVGTFCREMVDPQTAREIGGESHVFVFVYVRTYMKATFSAGLLLYHTLHRSISCVPSNLNVQAKFNTHTSGSLFVIIIELVVQNSDSLQ